MVGATYGATPPMKAVTTSGILILVPNPGYDSIFLLFSHFALFSIPGSTPNRAYAGIPADMTDCPGRTVGG